MQPAMTWWPAASPRRSPLWLIRCFLLLSCSVSSPLFISPPPATAGAITPELRTRMAAAAERELPVIVTFTARAELPMAGAQARAARRAGVVKALRQTAERQQQEARALLQREKKRFEALWIVNGLALQASPPLIAALAARPEVARVEIDDTVRIPAVSPGETVAAQWNIDAVGAPALWARGLTGEGVTVAILDSGVDLQHPDLRARWRGGGNSWFDPYRQAAEPYDPDPVGHGTLVAGIILGGDAGGTAIGVAPGARWIAARIFDDSGTATSSRILTAFQWLLDPDRDPATDDAPDVVNNSWGFGEIPGRCDPLFRTAVANLKAAEIAVVFAAGNAGPDGGTSISPANYPESLAVGAVDGSLQPALFSSRGPSACDDTPFPELVAPGVNVRSALPSPPFLPPQYQAVDGTSFAAPHVAGVMALLLSAGAPYPRPTVAELEAALRTAATDLGPPGVDNASGFGLVSAPAAFSRLADVLRLRQPAGGEELTAGTLCTIRWTPLPGAACYHLQYSLDNGEKWRSIRRVGPVTSMQWKVPPVRERRDACRLRVTACDRQGKPLASDVSALPFAIVPGKKRGGGVALREGAMAR